VLKKFLDRSFVVPGLGFGNFWIFFFFFFFFFFFCFFVNFFLFVHKKIFFCFFFFRFFCGFLFFLGRGGGASLFFGS